MKIPYTAILAAALVVPVNAQDAAPATPAAAAAEAPAADEAEYAKQLERLHELFNGRRELVAALKGISSRETADAAAPKVKKLCGKLRECETKHFKLIQKVPKAMKQRLEKEFFTLARSAYSDTNYALGLLSENGYYGSAALWAALEKKDAAEIQLSAEEQAVYAGLQASWHEFIDTMKRVIVLLRNVDGKESADAAAPKVKLDIERLFALEEILHNENIPDSVATKLQAEFYPTHGCFMSSMHINASCLEANKCYGSDALMKAMSRLMNGGEEEPAGPPAEN